MTKNIIKNLLSYFFPLYILALLSSCQSKKETIRPQISLMTESIYAYSEVKPMDFYNAYSAKAGIIQKVYVEVGDSVTKDQVLMKVTSNLQKINLKNAELQAKIIEENYQGETNLLVNIRKEIEALKKQVYLDSINLKRQENLWNKQIGTLAKLEQMNLQYDLSTNRLETLQKNYFQKEFELQNSNSIYSNLLKKEQSALQDHFIKSRINGKVYSLLKEEGEVINQQEPFAQLGQNNLFLVELQIDEVDIVKVDLDQQVLIHLDAYPDEIYEASVSKIYPIKETGTQSFRVDCQFIKVPKVLYAGMSGEANVIIKQKDDALTIPVEYLSEGNKVKTESGELNVKTGLRNLQKVEILSGLDTNTVILKYLSE